MSGVDERIVGMQFKGDSFLSGVKNTILALTGLKNSLNSLKGSEKDLNALNQAGKKVDLSGISKSADEASHHFNLLQIAGLTVFTKLVGQAFYAGENILKALTIDPLKAGLDVYETKINAIQTILANTSSEGTNLKQVTAALDQLNQYANLTVYNFGEMAKNIGTFTAAGVNLKTSVESIKGIANLAALSGSTSEQASTAMYQLSQAIAAGTVKLQDWNSVVNAGLGGKVFQNALIETARASGVAIDSIIKKAGSFRNSLQQGWLTSTILTKTLATFTGDLTNAQLKAMGFTAQEIVQIQKQARLAVNSATQIRTVSQLFQALKEEVATAWSKVFEAVIGNITQATSVLSNLHSVAETALTAPIYKLAALLQNFRQLGGINLIIDGVRNSFHSLSLIISTIGSAFRAVFPSSGGGAAQGLLKMAQAFDNLTKKLTPSKQTLADLKTIFEGVFSVIKIVVDVIGGLIGGITKASSSAGSAGGGFLHLVADVGSLVIKFKNLIESGTALSTFFKVLGTIITFPIKAIGAIISALGHLGGAASGAVAGVGGFVGKIGDEFKKLADAVVNGIKSGDFSKVGTIINQLLLAGVLVKIKKFITSLGKSSGESGGLFSTIKESFEQLTGTLRTMQQTLKASILEKIAIAVGILTASLVALSFVNVGNLVKALVAITVLFTELGVALNVVSKIAGAGGVVKMAVISAALILLATSIIILAGAVAILAQFSWDQLAKGLSAIAILLTELSVAVKLMSGNAKGMLVVSASLVGIATALNIMALAVAQLGKLNFSTLEKGVGTVAALLFVIAGFQRISGGEKLISSAAGMILIGAALEIIASAVSKLGSLSLGTLGKGLGAVAASLLVLVTAMNSMKGGLGGASAMLVAASALLVLSKAISSLSTDSWEGIGKALAALAASLILMSGAMNVLQGAIGGAAALTVMATGLAILTGVLVVLGHLPWDVILKGLGALAGIFIIMGAAGALLAPIAPAMLLVGAALIVMGVGVVAAGAGILVLSIGLTALGVALVATGAAILALIKEFTQLPAILIGGIANAISTILKALSNLITTVVQAFTAIFTAVLDAITKIAPKFAAAMDALITAMVHIVTVDGPKLVDAVLRTIQLILTKIATYFPKYVQAGLQLIVNLLNGIAREVPKIAAAATNIVIAFIKAITDNTLRIVQAGINMVINLLNGIANELRKSTPALQAAERNLGESIITGMIAGITGALGGLINAVVHAVQAAYNAAKHWLQSLSPSKRYKQLGIFSMQGLAEGHTASISLVEDSVVEVAKNALQALAQTMAGAEKIFEDNLNLNPRITPVVDLTQAQKGFAALAGLSKSQLISAGTSASSAASISAANAAAAAQAGLLSGAPSTTLQFTQYNNSPVALSAATIYRQTKNQLSIARGVLTGSANTG